MLTMCGMSVVCASLPSDVFQTSSVQMLGTVFLQAVSILCHVRVRPSNAAEA